MAAPTLSPVLSGDTGPVARPKINGNDAAILTYAKGLDARLAAIETAGRVQGAYTDPVGPNPVLTYSALATPYGAATRLSQTLLGAVPHADALGGHVMAPMGNNLYLVAGLAIADNSYATATNRGWAGVYEILPSGAATLKASATFTIAQSFNNASGYYTSYLSGAVATSPTTVRLLTCGGTVGPVGNLSSAILDLAYDPAAATLTSAYTTLGQVLRNATAAMPSRFPRRAWLMGTASCVYPEGFGDAASQRYYLGLLSLERGATAVSQAQAEGGSVASATFAVTRLDADTLAFLRLAQAGPGRAQQLVVDLVRVDDDGPRRVFTLGLPGAVNGNLRIDALSANLLVAGWSAGAQYQSVPISRSGDTLTFEGLQAFTGGALGAVQTGFIPCDLKRAAVLTRGAGWAATLTPISVDPAANPIMAAGAGVALTLGNGLSSWTSAHNVQITAFEMLGPDKAILLLRNFSLNQTAIEVYQFS